MLKNDNKGFYIITSVPRQVKKGDIVCGYPRTKDAEDITLIDADVKDEGRVTISDLRTKNKVSVYPFNSRLRRTWAPVKNWSFPILNLFI